jgi:acyl-CoA reductase-like NAD-dependent aldehyde dehydrogenase
MATKVEMVPCFNPATGEQFSQVPAATAEDVAKAKREMRAASEIWRTKPVKERIRILRKLQTLIIDSLDEISQVINQDTGKSRQDGLIEVFVAVNRLNRYYKYGPRWLARKRVPPGLFLFKRYYTEPQPYGVVAVICPWNYPFELVVSPMCSALLAGNTVIVKPSEVTGAVGALVEKLVLSVPELAPFVRFLHGGPAVGEALVRSKPDLIYLTGSTKTGFKVAQMAGESMTPYLLELGGKDPMIVLEDADIQAAARWGAWGSYYNSGQTCIAVERVYVVEKVYDAYLSAVLEETRRYTLGYTPELETPYNLGPLTFDRQKRIIEEHLQDALAKGARILHGGEFDNLFMTPTIVVDVTQEMKIMQDETFGPVMPIMKVRSEDEAIQLANDSLFGLSASVWSRDLERAQRVAHRLEVGSVNINDNISHYGVSLMPFGGVKQSGTARSHGREEVTQFTQLRSVSVGRPPLAIDLATQLRNPGRYWLGSAILHLAFGENLGQRLRPITRALSSLRSRKGGAYQVRVLPGLLALLTGITALLFGLWKARLKEP